MGGFELYISLFLVFYKKMATLNIIFDEICVKRLCEVPIGLGSFWQENKDLIKEDADF